MGTMATTGPMTTAMAQMAPRMATALAGEPLALNTCLVVSWIEHVLLPRICALSNAV